MISNVRQIKEAANIVEIIQEVVKLKSKGSNMVGLCPFHTEHTPSFTVSKEKGIYKCFGCGKSGDVIDFLIETKNLNYIDTIKFLANKYHIQLEEENNKYKRPAEREIILPNDIISYFQKRGISANTLADFKILQSVEWMPKAQKEVLVICFNYYRDGELINIKFRAKDKDFKLHKDAELIFYNLDAIKDQEEIIIVEGEIDCLTLHEIGIRNVVSVPNGASANNLKYLDNCWQYFENKKKIILATDNDEPGIKLKNELARRLGKEICYTVEYPKDCKDVNDVLVKHNKFTLQLIIDAAKQWPIEGVFTMDDLFDQVKKYYEEGYPEGLKAGIEGFDELLTFSGGQLTVVTGSPGSGKSEFIDYISTSLSTKHGWRFGICSFENPAAIHVTKLMEKFVGLSFNFRKNPDYRINAQQFEQGVAMVDKYFLFINISQADVTINGILNKLRELVLRTGIKAAIIDPWNYIEHKIPDGQTETQYISESLTLIKEFALKNDVHIFLIAHPRKLTKDIKTKQYPVPTMYDISGSAHFFNKADNGISIHRDFGNGVVDVYIQKVRFSWIGEVGFTSFTFDTMTRQYIKK